MHGGLPTIQEGASDEEKEFANISNEVVTEAQPAPLNFTLGGSGPRQDDDAPGDPSELKYH